MSLTIVVTGATGFVGLNLLHVLSELGHRVVGLATTPIPHAAQKSLAAGSGTVPVVEEVDVRHAAAVTEALQRFAPDAVIHSAAVTASVKRERSEAHRIVDVNVGGTQTVLDACTAAEVGRLVYVSSGAVYGDLTFGTDELTEATPVTPTGLYGITKLTGELLVRRHGQLHPLETVTARLSAVFGPWEYSTGVRDFMTPLLQLFQAARSGEPSRYVLDAQRNWLNVADVARALATLAVGPKPIFDCYNVCPSERFEVGEWIRRLQTAFPAASFEPVEEPGDATVTYDADPRRPRAEVSNDRITQQLGRQWCADSGAALDDYLQWLQSHPDWPEAASG